MLRPNSLQSCPLLYLSLTEIAAVKGVRGGEVTRTAQLIRLAPEIVESCLSDGSGGPKLEQLALVCLAGTWDDKSSLISNGSEGR